MIYGSGIEIGSTTHIQFTIIMPLHSLDTLEQVEHLPLVHTALAVSIALLHCAPGLLVAAGGNHSHPQAQVPVGVEELLALEFASLVGVVLRVDLLDSVPEHLVVDVGVPAPRVVEVHVGAIVHVGAAEAVHVGVAVRVGVAPTVHVGVAVCVGAAPAVEGVVPVMSRMAVISVSSPHWPMIIMFDKEYSFLIISQIVLFMFFRGS